MPKLKKSVNADLTSYFVTRFHEEFWSWVYYITVTSENKPYIWKHRSFLWCDVDCWWHCALCVQCCSLAFTVIWLNRQILSAVCLHKALVLSPQADSPVDLWVHDAAQRECLGAGGVDPG